MPKAGAETSAEVGVFVAIDESPDSGKKSGGVDASCAGKEENAKKRS